MREWTERHIREIIEDELKKLKNTIMYLPVIYTGRGCAGDTESVADQEVFCVKLEEKNVHYNGDDYNFYDKFKVTLYLSKLMGTNTIDTIMNPDSSEIWGGVDVTANGTFKYIMYGNPDMYGDGYCELYDIISAALNTMTRFAQYTQTTYNLELNDGDDIIQTNNNVVTFKTTETGFSFNSYAQGILEVVDIYAQNGTHI